MREALEDLIKEYEKRTHAMQQVMYTTTNEEQRKSVSGKYHVLTGVIFNLKEVLNATDHKDTQHTSNAE